MPINYLEVFSDDNIAKLHDWINETGELYVDIYYPHSGGSGTPYFIKTLSDLRELVAKQTWDSIGITIYKNTPYSIRGVADEKLLTLALKTIDDGIWYSIVSLDDTYPSPCSFLGSGNSHKELRNEMHEVFGVSVGIGINPFDYEKGDIEWINSHPDEVMYFGVIKTQKHYSKFREKPENYLSAIKLWRRES